MTHPLDTILADVGMMARRAMAGTLTPPEVLAIERRIRDGVIAQNADRGGSITYLLNSLTEGVREGTLTHLRVEVTMTRIRDRLTPLRDQTADRLPPRLSLIQGGRADQPTTH